MAEVRATPLPQLAGQRQAVLDRPTQQQTAPAFQPLRPSDNSLEMQGLLHGLSSFNQNLSGYTDQAIQKENIAGNKAALEQAAADAASDPVGVDIEAALRDQPLPSNVPIAFGSVYRQERGQLLVDRAAQKLATDLSARYNEARKDPDFDPEAFLAKERQEALGGLTNPNFKGRMGLAFSRLEAGVRSAAEKERFAKLAADEDSAIFTKAEGLVDATTPPSELGAKYTELLGTMRNLGRTPQQAVGVMLTRLAAVSNEKGGDPALFDVFSNTVDPATGRTLLQLNPSLEPQVAQLKQQAKAMQSRELLEKSYKENIDVQLALDSQRDKDPSSITAATVKAHTGPYGLFKTDDQAVAYLHHAQRLIAQKGIDEQILADWGSAGIPGKMGMYPDKVQKETAEERIGPYIRQAWQEAMRNPDPVQGAEAAKVLGNRLLQEVSRANLSVTVDSLENLLNTSVTSAPDKAAGPSKDFLMAAAIYKTWSGAPEFRAKYFKGTTGDVLEAYNRGLDEHGDMKVAYTKAYDGASPAAKAAAAETLKSPEFTQKLKSVGEEVSNSPWYNSWFGLGTDVSNSSEIRHQVRMDAEFHLRQNPGMSPKDAVKWAEGEAKSRYVMDKTSGYAVKVPKGLADVHMGKALEMSTAAILAKENPQEGWNQVQYRQNGDNGSLAVYVSDGTPVGSKFIGVVSAQELRGKYLETLHNSPQETVVLDTLRQQLNAGAVNGAFVAEHATEIAKFKRLGHLSETQLDKIGILQKAAIRANLDALPKLDLGAPTTENLQFNPKYGNRVDAGLTASIALRQYNFSKPHGLALTPLGPPEWGLASSLITMREGVMPSAYTDPNPKAGKNIGMGYNLTANAATVHKDLMRAGVPSDKVQAVIDGKAMLTPQQAELLLVKVSLPRYMKIAQEAADSTAPGLWSQMTPQQKAVMADVAWQTGSPDKFKKAWSALAAGDSAKFAEETRVFYDNAKGERVEDKRAGDLRKAMLSGDGTWLATVKKYGSFQQGPLKTAAN